MLSSVVGGVFPYHRLGLVTASSIQVNNMPECCSQTLSRPQMSKFDMSQRHKTCFQVWNRGGAFFSMWRGALLEKLKTQ